MKKTGGPAFPFPSGPEPRVNEFHDRWEGMTLRQYYAGEAIKGLVGPAADPSGVWAGDPMRAAEMAVQIADALIAVEEKTLANGDALPADTIPGAEKAE